LSAPEFTILYDGECPLCRREVEMLARLDAGRGRLARVDIASPGFDPGRYGRSLETLMARIHGVRPDGTVIEGVEVFRRAYAAVDRGAWLAWTGLPIVRPVVDAAYRWFARNRLRLTGRAHACDADACRPGVERPSG
jgi:predicted DCC family thiol-disulfide oxidoreductase YuxK